MGGHLVSFHILATINNAAMNIAVHLLFQISTFVSGRYIPRSRITGSYGSLELPQLFSGKESTYDAGATGDVRSIPGLGRSPGGVHSNPLQYSSLEDTMDRGAWQATVHRVTNSQT